MTISRELRRNAQTVPPQDRFFYFRVERFWTEDQLDEYFQTQPPEARGTEHVWTTARTRTPTRRSVRAAMKRM